MKAFILIFVILIFCSCRQVNNENENIILGDFFDTIKVTKRYSSGKIREIIYYKDNRPNKNIGFTEKGDSLTFPKLIYINSSDSLFAFIPMHRYNMGAIFFKIDSTNILSSNGQPKYSIDILNSSMLKITPNMRSEKNKIIGVFKFKSLDGTYDYWPFDIDINNR